MQEGMKRFSVMVFGKDFSRRHMLILASSKERAIAALKAQIQPGARKKWNDNGVFEEDMFLIQEMEAFKR